jgi:CHAT domain-containing protein/tetratricopeptide (TPR) repeat protein
LSAARIAGAFVPAAIVALFAAVVGARPATQPNTGLAIAAAPFAATQPDAGVATASAPSSISADSIEVLLRAGRYSDAERAALASLRAAEKAPGPDSMPVAIALEQVVRARAALSRSSLTDLSLAARATAIRERAYGPGDPRVATGLIVIANVWLRLDRTDEARASAERALTLLAPAGPEFDSDRARGLQVLANVDLAAGDFDASVTHWTELHAMRERLNGAESPEAAQALHSLGVALRNAGRSVEAMRCYRRALAIRERVLGPDHPDVAWTLNNLANVMFDVGDYPEAIRLNRRALAIREKRLGPDHPDVGLSLNNLANAIDRNGDPAAAAPLHERGLAIREAARGPWHRDVAQSLNNLGLVRMELGDYDRARSLFERSIAIRDSLLGPGSEEGARTRLRLGYLYLHMNQPRDAERVLREAVAANRAALGPNHLLGADAEIALAAALLRLGGDAEALDLALAAERVSREHLRLAAQGLDEAQALTYAANRSDGLAVALTLAAAAPNDSARVARVWDTLLRARSVVLDETIARRRWAAEGGDSAARVLYARVTAARDRLARLALQGAGGDSTGAARLADAVREKGEAERSLAERNPAFGNAMVGAAAGWPEVRAQVPSDAALVAYVSSQVLPRGAATDTVERMLAFVYGPHGRGPRLVDLGPNRDVDRAARVWCATLRTPPDPLRRARDERACDQAGRALARFVWDPIAPLVAGAERVFVVPDGALHLTPLAALPDARGRSLVETGPLLQMLAIERDLAQPPGAGDERKRLLAIGGPAFDGGSARSRAAPARTSDPCAVLRGGRFEALPGTAAEAATVARTWDAALPAADRSAGGAVVLTGVAASERALRERIPGCRAVHIAAHGFFLPAQCPFVTARSDEAVALAARQPLLRAGLALAGANLRATAKDPADDGILTAEEIAGLSLGSLDWAVLSACETGLGELDANEGVLGLRRAFRAAGARALVMSLWRVDDAATAEWMRELYDARFRLGLDGAAAAQRASRAMLVARRTAGRTVHPYYWAGFIFEGDDRRR